MLAILLIKQLPTMEGVSNVILIQHIYDTNRLTTTVRVEIIEFLQKI